jgi:hypothetical protein
MAALPRAELLYQVIGLLLRLLLLLYGALQFRVRCCPLYRFN